LNCANLAVSLKFSYEPLAGAAPTLAGRRDAKHDLPNGGAGVVDDALGVVNPRLPRARVQRPVDRFRLGHEAVELSDVDRSEAPADHRPSSGGR
jgi:hypothetical protein